MVRRALLATILTMQFGCTPVLAQMSTTTMPPPGIPGTSPSLLVVTPGASITPAGIPLGATRSASPGLSPTVGSATAMPGTGMPGFGTTCTTAGSQLPGSLATTPASMTGSATCASGLSSSTPSLTSTSNLAGGGVTGTGFSSRSLGIGGAGVNPLVVAPASIAPPPHPLPLLLLGIPGAPLRALGGVAPR